MRQSDYRRVDADELLAIGWRRLAQASDDSSEQKEESGWGFHEFSNSISASASSVRTDDGVSTGSGSDRVSINVTIDVARRTTRSLPLPVLTSSLDKPLRPLAAQKILPHVTHRIVQRVAGITR